MPAGRPTKYRPEYCQKIIDFCAQGFSITAFAGENSLSRDVITDWGKRYPQFFAAVQIAKAASARWWEGVYRDVATGKPGNPALCIFAVKNMAQDDWQERRGDTGPAQIGISVTREGISVTIGGELQPLPASDATVASAGAPTTDDAPGAHLPVIEAKKP